MVQLSEQTLRKSKHFEEFYKTPGVPSKMGDKEIKNYLGSYGCVNDNQRFDFASPTIASPIGKPKKGLEFKSWNTGDVTYFGPYISGKLDDNVIDSHIGRDIARFDNRKVNIDTYYNKVFYEAWKRGIIKLYDEEKEGILFLSDLMNLGLNAEFKRDSVQNRRFLREMNRISRAENSLHPNTVIGVAM